MSRCCKPVATASVATGTNARARGYNARPFFVCADEPESATTRRRRIQRRPPARAGGRRFRQDPRDRRENRAPDCTQAHAAGQDRRDHVHQQGCARDARARGAVGQGRGGGRTHGRDVPCAGPEDRAGRTRQAGTQARIFGIRCRRQRRDHQGSRPGCGESGRHVRAAQPDLERQGQRPDAGTGGGFRAQHARARGSGYLCALSEAAGRIQRGGFR